MAYFKNYSFEYNAQRVDVFRSVVVCSYQSETDSFREGIPINIDDAGFYGVISSCKNSGDRLTLDVIAESWGRELRNTAVDSSNFGEYRQIDVVDLINDHLIPASWDFTYPSEFDTKPRYISYILRNGNYLSHIGTVLDAVGLDFTIFSTMSGGVLTKTVQAFYRDNFDGRTQLDVVERVNCGNLSITSDYGKVCTSIIVKAAESELGVTQVFMDAEIGNWHQAPRLLEIKDTVLKMPEMSETSKYFWYEPASVASPLIEIFESGDSIVIDDESMVINSVWFLAATDVASWQATGFDNTIISSRLHNISAYEPTGVIVASVTFGTTSIRNWSPFLADVDAIHSKTDNIYMQSVKVASSPYLTFEKNLPATNGFVWLGSERCFYKTASDYSTYFTVSRMTRGVPTCAVASCQHCGTANHLSYTQGLVCKLFENSGALEGFCTLLATGKSTLYPSDEAPAGNGLQGKCPLLFAPTSQCPALRCPHIRVTADSPTIDNAKFATICPKGLTRDELNESLTERYQHNKGSIVFPASYYSNVDGVEEYDIYSSDSLIHKYGYLPTTVTAKGIADPDGLDKFAEGRLRLSAIPTVGTLTLFSYDPWVVPASAFPGGVVRVTVASHARYNHVASMWYPTQWFDVSPVDPVSPDWQQVEVSSWVQITKKFVIQKTTKDQRGYPVVSFGSGDIGFSNLTDYIAETMDVTSQRHRNQDPSKIIATSETGLAAQVMNIKTGKIDWVRMAR